MNTPDSTVDSRGSGPTGAGAAALPARYELLEEIGRGGMGVVYKARHVELNTLVAVKVCHPGGPADRFQREGRLAARVRSPYVVTVHDFDRLPDGRLLLAMEWVDGSNLAAVLKACGGPIPEPRAVAWMRQVCQAMQAAAEHGVVHRDLKPSNILITRADVAQVADFGLARAAEVEELTLPGSTMGTPSYMAPEQAEDPRGADARSDVYSFGATFYHVLTGRPPFQGQTNFSVMVKHKLEPVVAPRARNPGLSPHLSECLERCLAKSPADRFQSFAELLACLQPQAGGADVWDGADDPEVERHLAGYRARRGAYLDPACVLAHPDTYAFPHGRSLVVLCGNLADQRADALVSSDDEYLTMGGGVSAALRRAAGPGFFEEARRFVPVRHGRAAVTSAGRLPARFVFHAVTIGWDTGHGRPSRDIVHELLESCLYHADTLGVKSIAFPLLGTGVGMLDPDVCLDTMVRFLARKLARGATTVQEARVVLFRRGL